MKLSLRLLVTSTSSVCVHSIQCSDHHWPSLITKEINGEEVLDPINVTVLKMMTARFEPRLSDFGATSP